jgi:hypothetical protein
MDSKDTISIGGGIQKKYDYEKPNLFAGIEIKF